MSGGPPTAFPATWDSVADAYARHVAPVFEHFADDALRLISPGRDVLDVATGPGTLALIAAARGHEVTAIDFSTEMIERLDEEALKRHVKLMARVGDGMELDVHDATFDAAFSMFGLIFFPDRAKGLAELHRALRPGGRVLISSWQAIEHIPFFMTLFSALGEMFPMPGGPPPPVLATPEECVRELTAAGFIDVQVHHRAYAFEAVSLAEFWSWFPASCAPLAALGKKLGGGYHDVLDKLFAKVKAEHGPGPVRVEMPALLTMGTKP